MKKIIILGTLIVVVIIFLLSTLSKSESDYIEKSSKNESTKNRINTDLIGSIETNSKSILFEDFSDEKNLDDWNISYQNATNWMYDITDSTGIIINDIINEAFSKDLYGPWANVILEKTIPAKDSMIFISKISWDSFDLKTSMQHIYFSFIDTNDDEILFFGYNDPYIDYKGGILSKFYDQPYNWYKKRELNFKGDCLLKMVKKGNNMKLYYNNDFMMQSTTMNNIKKINIICGYFPSINYKNSNLISTFGSLGIDFIKILDSDTPLK